jgi:hypothetical protein
MPGYLVAAHVLTIFLQADLRRSRKEHDMIKRLSIVLMVAIMLLIICTTTSNAASGKAIKASGMLVSVEHDGTVVIDGNGYNVDVSARILDSAGKKIKLDELKLPERIQYQFIYEQSGPVITLIRLLAH